MLNGLKLEVSHLAFEHRIPLRQVHVKQEVGRPPLPMGGIPFCTGLSYRSLLPGCLVIQVVPYESNISQGPGGGSPQKVKNSCPKPVRMSLSA